MTRILVIEDETNVRENIMDLLDLEGYQTSGAVDGYEGYFLACTESFDLVVCDIMLPRMDGFEVLQRLRRDPRTMDLPLIFLTARTQREAQREGMNLGAEDYITKPYTRVELLQSIQSRLERKKVMDLALQSHWKDRQRDIAYQIPLEFSGPLSVILHSSSLLAERLEPIQVVNASELGKQIHQSALILMESVQKYLFLSDLETRTINQRLDGVTHNAGVLMGEVLADRAKKVQISTDGALDFSCVIREDDYLKFSEYLVDFVLLTADLDQSIELVGRLDHREQKAHLSFIYKIPGAKAIIAAMERTADRPSAVIRETHLILRMAELLGLTLDVNQRETQTLQVTLRLPLDLKTHGD